MTYSYLIDGAFTAGKRDSAFETRYEKDERNTPSVNNGMLREGISLLFPASPYKMLLRCPLGGKAELKTKYY